ncbi:MAG: serine/threonine-protein kinase [Proteobacteria bacterium]|nr:serine/threonine-protein kinase [Pseudomonadota bacterium]
MSSRNAHFSPDGARLPQSSGRNGAVFRRDDALIGRCLEGKFVLRELIGEGPSGRVYRADQVALNRTVAVKVLRPVYEADVGIVRRFHDEAFAISRLHHPNVLSIYDYGHTKDGLLYIAMEFLSGRTLSNVILDDHPIPIRRVVTVISQVLDALEEAHTAGVIHADLKSDNVIVDELRDGRVLAKVIDFTIAHLFHGGAGEGTTEAESRAPTVLDLQFAGSPEYMAPELVVGACPSRATDIYAAGVILHELLTGNLPSSEGIASQTLEQARGLYNEADGPDEHQIAAELGKIVECALASDPNDRFADVSSFRRAVQNALEVVGKRSTCPRCGNRNDASFRFCAECGARLLPARDVGETEDEFERAKSEAKRAFANGNADQASQILVRAIGRAIRLGNRAMIIGCYQILAALQTEAGAPKKAIRELEEAIDLVTSGTATDVPESLWQLQMQLAKLYFAIGRQRDAVSMGSRALVSARQASSASGRHTVQAFMSRLYTEVRKQTGKAVEKLSADDDESDHGDTLFSGERSIQTFLDDGDTEPWRLIDDDKIDGE